MFSLSGKVALVTGGSQGIGAGICRCLAQAGATVAVNYLKNGEKAASVLEEIHACGSQGILVQADVRKESEVIRMVNTVFDTYGRIDILVSNAGLYRPGDIKDTPLETWYEVLDTDITGAFLVTKHVLPIMERQRWGRCIYTSSGSAYVGTITGAVHYPAAKAGQIALAKSLVRTESQYRITFNCLAPGLVVTASVTEDTKLDEAALREREKAFTLGFGKPEDIGYAAVYLASEEARWITGAVLDLNGGLYLRA